MLASASRRVSAAGEPALELSPAALDDLDAAADWYDAQRPGLGDAFVTAVDSCLARIEQVPLAFRERVPGVRSALVQRFPYTIIFRVRNDCIEILAVWHGQRDLKDWLDRL